MDPAINALFFKSTYYLLMVCLLTTAMGSKGRDFIFGFMENYEVTYLLIASDKLANVKVEAPLIPMNATYQTVDGYLRVDLIAMLHSTTGKGNKGISLRSDVDISVYAVSDLNYSPESVMVIPVPFLGKRNIVGMFPSGNYVLDSSEILIVAGYKDTSIQITVRSSVPISIDDKMYKYGDVYSLELSEYETFFLKTAFDLTGTEIISSKPVSVFSGNQCVRGRYGQICDHIVEQMPPIPSLSTNFVMTPFFSKHVTFITTAKLVAAYENTEISIQGERTYMLNAGEYVEREISTPEYINASKAILLLEMAEMKNGGSILGDGDPSMIVLPSISQFSNNYIFSLPTGVNVFDEHHIVVTIESKHQHGILLDGVHATAEYIYYVSDPDRLTHFSVLVYEVSGLGRHHIQHLSADVKFGAVLYGAGDHKSYGHPLGMELQTEDCVSAPCQNGGTCEDLFINFRCICPNGFYGDLCETGICHPQPADMIFILDSSVSQTEENFRKQLDFVSNFTDQVLIGPNDTQICVITFSSDVHLEFDFYTHRNNVTLKAAIQGLKFKPGITRTDKALQKAKVVADDATNRRRPTGKQARVFVFVLTDGMSTYRDQTKREAEVLKRYVEAIAAVGIGNQVSHKELRDIASSRSSGDSSFVFSVENFDSLYTIVTKLVHITCEECARSAMTDVLLMIDESVNTSSADSIQGFSKLLDSASTLVALIDFFGNGHNETRVSLASFSDTVRTYVNFSEDFITKVALRQQISRISNEENAIVNMTSVFRYINEHGFDLENGVRTDARRFFVLFTNGGYDLDIHFQKQREAILKKGATIITVGMESEVHMQNLLQIASGPYHVIVESENTNSNLDVLKRELVYDKCQLNFVD
ncbi:hypothetical protein CHS0354_039787 [Potamilus streckersoni]|uniref:Uncharacterized protein n=1 Tax=Potamilus streckersoni TaxID=2493646 RepID=A0AAE0S074_9BIVA|nr:hypothetical protein CHS0354_039787 [Potamilus streckersoni]